MKTSIYLASAISLLGSTNTIGAFSPSSTQATRQTLTSSLFQPKQTSRRVPLFAEENSSSDAASSSSSSSSADIANIRAKVTQSSKSIFAKIDEYGIALKPKAMEAKEKISKVGGTSAERFRYRLQSCGLFTLFILYRAYRGFFVILPAIFQQVFKKMEKTVESPFTDDITDGTGADVNPKTGKIRLRTTVTVSILAAIVTLSYAVTGACYVFGQFVSTITKTSSASTSFLAAADEMEVNESKIMRLTKSGNNNGLPVNGERKNATQQQQ